MKKLKGYTLLELVVAMAIIGILSATLMPNMVGQVGKSKFNTVQQQARSIFNSAQAIAQKYETIDRAISADDDKRFSGKLTFGNLAGVTFNDTNLVKQKDANSFYTKLKAMNNNLESCKWAVIIENYKVTHVLYSASDTDGYVGVYCSCGSHTVSDYSDYDKEVIGVKWNDINTPVTPP